LSALILLSLAVTCALAQQPKELTSAPGQTSVAGALPTGAYEVTFRLEIDKPDSSVTPLATLSVSLPGLASVIYKQVTAINFPAAGTPTDFRFTLDNFKAQDVQAAVQVAANQGDAPKLTVDKITVAPYATPVVANVWPGKVLYHTNENATGMVAVYNGAAEPQTLTLRCVLESDLDKARPLKDIPVTLAAGERREVPITWNTGAEEYGFALAATLVDGTGKTISQGREYFSVADNLWKVALTESGRGCGIPYGPGPNRSVPISDIQKAEEELAKALAAPLPPVYWHYSNYNELGLSPDCFFNQAPAEDYWYTGMGDYTEGKRHVQLGLQWLHRWGMRATSYVLPSPCGASAEPVYRRHPDWFAYDKNGQVAGSLYEKKLEVSMKVGGPETPWPLQLAPYALWLSINIERPEPIDAFVDQTIKAHQMFGWDGIRFDVAPFVVGGYDFNGKLIGGTDPKHINEVEVAAWKRMRDSIWKALGRDFVIGLNSDRDLYHDQYPDEWDECCREGQLLMEEVPRSCYSPQSPRNVWHEYMRFYHEHGDIVRALGGHHLIIGFDVQNPVDQLYMNVITYAERAHPYAYQYHSETLPLGNYAQFVTRYAALIWDIDRVQPWPEAEKSVEVASASPVWWKELACVRSAPDGKRQYILHLINPPVQERIYSDPTNKVPTPQKDVQVTLRLDAGEKITRAWLLSADPTTHEEALPLTAGADQVSVTVPQLYFWSMVVFE
jgi:hypothetical protein